MAKLTKVALVAVGVGAVMASEAMAQYRPGLLGVDTNLRARQYTPPPAPPVVRPTYTPPPVMRPTYTPPPRAMDLRPPSIITPQPKPNPNVVRTLPPLPPLPPAPPPAPKRFEGGGIVVPTPTGGAAGSGVLRDNKNGVTIDGHMRTEPGGGTSVNGGVTKDIP
jgi:hypothetical protein